MSGPIISKRTAACAGAIAVLAIGLATAGIAREKQTRGSTPAQVGSDRGAINLRQVDGPRFFTIQAVVDRKNGVAPAARPTQDIGLRLTTLSTDRDAATPGIKTSAPFAAAGFHLFPSVHRGVAVHWASVTTQWGREKPLVARCAQDPAKCRPDAQIFHDIQKDAAGLGAQEQVALVNRRVNGAIAYQTDMARHGVADHWSSPLQVLGKAGDCEDYAITKYMLLRELGWSAADMMIVLLRDRRAREDHAVLAVRGGSGWRLLDNRWNRIDDDIAMSHYRPVIALNETAQRIFAAPYVEVLNDDEPELTLPTETVAVLSQDAADAEPSVVADVFVGHPTRLRGMLN
jgi:predicted transglutaminase-like cysteine proteinase